MYEIKHMCASVSYTGTETKYDDKNKYINFPR